MKSAGRFLRVAVSSPLRKTLDYLPLLGEASLPGARVRVSLGRRSVVGLLMEHAEESAVDGVRLKPIAGCLDIAPLLPKALLQLLVWASDYYQHPIGEVVFGALPGLLREGHPAQVRGGESWRMTAAGRAVDAAALKRAPRQAALLSLLVSEMSAEAFDAVQDNWRPTLRVLIDKGWVETVERPCLPSPEMAAPSAPPQLNTAQREAVVAVTAALDAFGAFLLDGVTGSGKTEVYLGIIDAVLARGQQALVLVPEIGLTPQLVQRFAERFPVPIAVLHSGLSDRERLCAWLAAKNGEAPIVIGTRSAMFTPLARPGLIVLDEEHDLSFKQQEGFRYSARDVAVKRAQLEGLPVVLGSATPSLESLFNTAQGRYKKLELPERAGEASHPDIAVLDVRKQPMHDGLSAALINTMRRHLEADGQVLLFLNRRGYAPTLLCHACGWVAKCKRCDAHMTLFQGQRRLRCHHCGAERPAEPACPECQATELIPVGAGTERLEERLRHLFPDIGIARIDRDTTRRKGAMQSLLDSVHDGSSRILVGTQMLAKGHHFPNVTLVGMVDVDQGLFSADFRGPERMAQLIVQVAGRAGRAQRRGQVLIQTHHPEHPLLQVLLRDGYSAFAQAALEERKQAQLPPFHYTALLRAEAVDADSPMRFLQRARELAAGARGVQILGPVPAPMERRAGRYRAQLLLSAASRGALHRLLTPWVLQLDAEKLGRKVRWSLDVDPQEMF